ncbi:4'-phosphopantetheinyl transferase [Sporodiniella umbellata]|nr:4'-phosphopantetheinyl transferase [Sporodiniella umbellata]
MILGIGVDILHLPRLNAVLRRRGSEKLAKRILSKAELSDFNRLESEQNMYLATRWCIKEAVYKALYPVHKLEWKQVTVSKEAGKPILIIDQSKTYGIERTHVSVSHDGNYAMAQVVLEGKPSFS